jgi:hypothetical protein
MVQDGSYAKHAYAQSYGQSQLATANIWVCKAQTIAAKHRMLDFQLELLRHDVHVCHNHM